MKSLILVLPLFAVFVIYFVANLFNEMCYMDVYYYCIINKFTKYMFVEKYTNIEGVCEGYKYEKLAAKKKQYTKTK